MPPRPPWPQVWWHALGVRLTRLHPDLPSGAWRLCHYPQVAFHRVGRSAVRSGMRPGWRVAVYSSALLPEGHPDQYFFLTERLSAQRVLDNVYPTRRDALWAVRACLED